jgi:hypothetical protein
MANVKALKKRYDALKADTERTNWESHCEELAQVYIPKKRGFVGEETPGSKKMDRVFDSTGIRAVELLASGLHGFASNPSTRWFSLSMADERITQEPEVKKYLSDVEEIMFSRMYSPNTGLITSLHECYMDLGAFGTAGMYTTWDEKGDHLKFESRTLNNIVVAESSRGIIDTVYRRFKWTVRQCVQEWGLDKLSGKIQDAYKSEKYDDKVDIVHAIFPRTDFNIKHFGANTAQNMPVASIYFEYEQMHMLEEGGFPEMPYAIPRWSRISGEVMGRSPGMTALPDVKMLQQMALTTIKAGQKAVDPPNFIKHDGFINPLRLLPGGINKVRGMPKDVIMPMPFSGNLPFAMENMDRLQNKIFDAFHVDQLQIVNDANMTATEVMQRTQERMRLLGPVLGRLESELLGPLVTRVFGLLHRLGKLPEPPEQIQDREFTVQYVSPIAQAQRAVEIDTWRQFVAANEVYLQAPETAAGFFKLYPVERVAQHFANLLNLDPDMGASSEDLEAAAQQEQMAQMAQLAQPALQGAQAVNQLSQAGANLPADVEGAQVAGEAAQNIDPAAIQQLGEQLQGALPN